MPDRITIKIEREDGTKDEYKLDEPGIELYQVDDTHLCYRIIGDYKYIFHVKRITPQKVKPICPRPAGTEPGIVTVIRGREQR